MRGAETKSGFTARAYEQNQMGSSASAGTELSCKYQYSGGYPAIMQAWDKAVEAALFLLCLIPTKKRIQSGIIRLGTILSYCRCPEEARHLEYRHTYDVIDHVNMQTQCIHLSSLLSYCCSSSTCIVPYRLLQRKYTAFHVCQSRESGFWETPA